MPILPDLVFALKEGDIAQAASVVLKNRNIDDVAKIFMNYSEGFAQINGVSTAVAFMGKDSRLSKAVMQQIFEMLPAEKQFEIRQFWLSNQSVT
jgi:hypothetical protein